MVVPGPDRGLAILLRSRTRRKGVSLLLAGALLWAFAGSVAATPPGTLDQSQPNAPYGWGAYTWSAQTFTAGLSGALTGVQLDCFEADAANYPGYTIQVWATSGGEPVGPALAISDPVLPYLPGACANTWVDFTFSSPATVTAGTQYAIVWTTSNRYWGFAQGSQSSDPYSAGTQWTSMAGTTWAPEDYRDWAFRTYVTTSESTSTPVPPRVVQFWITKSNDASAPVAPGSQVSFAIALSVTGAQGPVVGIGVVDQLPAGIGSVTAISDGGSYDPAANRVSWSGLSMTGTMALTYTAVVSASATPGTYTNTATIVQGYCGQTCTASSDVTVAVAATPAPTPSQPAASASQAGGAVGGEGGAPTLPPTSGVPQRGGGGSPIVLLVIGALVAASLVMAGGSPRRRRPANDGDR